MRRQAGRRLQVQGRTPCTQALPRLQGSLRRDLRNKPAEQVTPDKQGSRGRLPCSVAWGRGISVAAFTTVSGAVAAARAVRSRLPGMVTGASEGRRRDSSEDKAQSQKCECELHGESPVWGSRAIEHCRGVWSTLGCVRVRCIQLYATRRLLLQQMIPCQARRLRLQIWLFNLWFNLTEPSR